MRLASSLPGELIPCAFVWLDPGITPCCKTGIFIGITLRRSSIPFLQRLPLQWPAVIGLSYEGLEFSL
jgi:hypothetical protein